jgi:hypothetical protein
MVDRETTQNVPGKEVKIHGGGWTEQVQAIYQKTGREAS